MAVAALSPTFHFYQDVFQSEFATLDRRVYRQTSTVVVDEVLDEMHMRQWYFLQVTGHVNFVFAASMLIRTFNALQIIERSEYRHCLLMSYMHSGTMRRSTKYEHSVVS
jgi:hypothetical protein